MEMDDLKNLSSNPLAVFYMRMDYRHIVRYDMSGPEWT